ncbi:MAG: glycosyltransferase family 2 protein [Anaerolinea sp.]|nr:glycosyltransferase family 2 protein [Anaerolinea sp.]
MVELPDATWPSTAVSPNLSASVERPALVSVIMSVLNGEPYLTRAVDSILNQTYPYFEFIIIDDGSTDNTWQILTHYAQADSRVVLIRNEHNMGYTRSLNKGIAQAQGEFVARQDADDISHCERLARQIAFLIDHPQVGLLGTLPQFIDANDAVLPIARYALLTDNKSIQEELYNSNCFRHGSIIMRRTCLDMVGVYNADLEPSEDYDLWLRLAEVTELANLPEPLYLYREHMASESSKRRFRQMYHKAVALEQAVQRRFATAPAADKWVLVGRDFLRAAVLAWIDGNHAAAQEALMRAQTADGRLLERHDQLATITHRYLTREPVEKAIPLTETLFGELLPLTPPLTHIKAQLLSELHMEAVFAAQSAQQNAQIDAHLWPGIRYNPRWLRNRGILSLLLRRTFSFRRSSRS